MRIAFLTPEYVTEQYYSGGLANYIRRVSEVLVERGHEVHVLTWSNEEIKSFKLEGVHVHRIRPKFLQALFLLITLGKLPESCRWVAFSFLAWRKLIALHKEQPFDIFQTTNYRGCGLFSVLFSGIPHTVRISSYRPDWNRLSGVPSSLDQRLGENMEQLQLSRSKNIYAPSRLLKTILEKRAGVKNVEVIRTPFFMEEPHRDTSLVNQEQLDGKKYLLFFGRLQLHKGFHILAQALPKIFEAHQDLYAVFCGIDLPTPLAPSMEEYAKNLSRKYTDRMIFFGQTPHEKLYSLIENARLVVLPSLIDNLPNTLLEAMGLGRICVGTRGASFDEMITDGENGFLVPIGDPDALAQKIIDVWNRDDLEEIGKAASKSIGGLAPEITVQALLDHYESLKIS